MAEPTLDPAPGSEDLTDSTPPLEPTGDPAADAVLDLVEGLEERPVAEHVATYEEAHRRLRAALDGTPETGEGSSSDLPG